MQLAYAPDRYNDGAVFFRAWRLDLGLAFVRGMEVLDDQFTIADEELTVFDVGYLSAGSITVWLGLRRLLAQRAFKLGTRFHACTQRHRKKVW